MSEATDVRAKAEEALAQIDEIIALKRESLRLLEELRATYALALRSGVDPKEVDRFGYDQSQDRRWNKWPPYMKATIKPVTNYVILKDGRRVDVPIDWEGPLEEERRKRRELQEEKLKRLGY